MGLVHKHISYCILRYDKLVDKRHRQEKDSNTRDRDKEYSTKLKNRK